MSDTAVADTPETSKSEDKEDWKSFGWFMVKLVAAVLIFRAFFFSPFTIPSESMLPKLQNGDYLVAAKWPYGYSKLSMPLEAPIIPGRILADLPERGDIAIFKHPVDGTDYIKRVIGLPGDTVELRAGRVILNGEELKQERTGNFDIALSPNTDCAWGGVVTEKDGAEVCRYLAFKETLPSGKSYTILDFGTTRQDTTKPVIVPKGQLFVLGDNRDNSQDSRFAATPGGGVGLVPADLLVGRASMVLWSTDGSAEWIKPWTWFTAARWHRIGEGL